MSLKVITNQRVEILSNGLSSLPWIGQRHIGAQGWADAPRRGRAVYRLTCFGVTHKRRKSLLRSASLAINRNGLHDDETWSSMAGINPQAPFGH